MQTEKFRDINFIQIKKSQVSVTKSPLINSYIISAPKHRIKLRSWHPAWVFSAILIVLGFVAGMVTVFETSFSFANVETFYQQTPAGVGKTIDNNQQDLTVVANLIPILIEENRHQPTTQEIINIDRKIKLQNYLSEYKSPLAEDGEALDALLESKNMKMMLAIAFVEGKFCIKQLYKNCSGIGGSKMRKYDSFADWIRDFDDLLERRYKGLEVEDFIGYYVQPGSKNWTDGVYQILGELKEKGIE
jgi:hypothetical protein